MTRTPSLRVCLGAIVLTAACVSSAAAEAPRHRHHVALYAHGIQMSGEVDGVDGDTNCSFMDMTVDPPVQTHPRSQTIAGTQEVWTKPFDGTGFYPLWTTPELNGRISGRIRAVFEIVGVVEGPVIVSVSEGLPPCRANVPFRTHDPFEKELVAAVVVDIETGPSTLEVVMKPRERVVSDVLVVEIVPADSDVAGRILYDAVDFASRVEFGCAPHVGRTCTD